MRKIWKFILFTLLSLALIFSLFAVSTGRLYLFKAVWYNFANIDDYKIFSNNTVEKGSAQPWALSQTFNKDTLPSDTRQLLESLGTVSVLVIKEDSLAYEEYWDGYSDSSLSGSFSMAKSITSLLVGVALKEGKIKSLDEPIGDFLPSFRQGEKAQVRIIDLLTMSSGSDWDESYINPFSVTTEIYYGPDAYLPATSVKIMSKPGTMHRYKSGDTQLLGLVLEKATGESLSKYASDKLWKPVGAEHNALWSVDHQNGHEKAYCCFNSNARDFARIGQLMLDSGRWKGQDLISMDYYTQSIKPCLIPDGSGNPCQYYGFQWWLAPYCPGIFYARGILGQYIIVIPSKKEVVVRLGKMTSFHRVQTVPQEVDALIRWRLNL